MNILDLGAPSMPADQVPNWKVLGPGGGGATFFPTFHPTDPSRVAIRCDMTGIYLSSNGGESWAMHNLTSTASAFAFEPDSKDVVYVGTAGLFRTEDFGQSWERLFPTASESNTHTYFGDHAGLQFDLAPDSVYPSPSGQVTAILLHPDDPSILYVGIGGREGSTLCVSEDRGATWRRTAELDSGISGIFAAPTKPDAIYAVTNSTVYELSIDGAITHRRLLPDDVNPATRAAGGWDDDTNALRIYAISGVEDGARERPGRGYVSDDAGETWRRFDDRLIAEASIPPDDVAQSFACISTSSRDSRTAYAVCDRFLDTNGKGEAGTWYGILKTSDGGRSWSWIFKEGGGTGGYNVLDGIVADNVDDGWSTEAFGGAYLRVIDVGVSPSHPDTAIFTDWYRAMKTTDGGGRWTPLYSRKRPDSSHESTGLDVTTAYGVHFDPFDANHYAVSYTDIGYWHTFDNGVSWERSVNGIPNRWINTCYWVQFDPDVKDKLWSVWGSYHDLPKLKMTRIPGWKERSVGGVAVSLDGGRTWEATSDGIPPNAPTTCLLLDPSTSAGGRTLYAAVYGKGVYKSTDDGKSWVLKNKGITQDGPNVWELTFGADGTLYLIVAFNVVHDGGPGDQKLVDGMLYQSNDGAETWEPVALPKSVRFPNSLTPDPQNTNKLYLACWATVGIQEFRGKVSEGKDTEESDGGLLLSEDGGKTWRQVFDPETYVYGAAVDPRKPGRIYLVTFHHTAHFSDDDGATWHTMKGYDFHWGHRPVLDPRDPEKVYITTFGGSFWHGHPVPA